VLHASRITDDLWVGSAPPAGHYWGRFDVLVLVSSEYQPASGDFPGLIVRRFPFDDTEAMSKADMEAAWRAAGAVAEDILAGHRVLVTCNMGRNRSALVAALALHMLTGMSGEKAAKIVRTKRVDALGVRALSNPTFRAFLRKLP
jgi:hypothetical protein